MSARLALERAYPKLTRAFSSDAEINKNSSSSSSSSSSLSSSMKELVYGLLMNIFKKRDKNDEDVKVLECAFNEGTIFTNDFVMEIVCVSSGVVMFALGLCVLASRPLLRERTIERSSDGELVKVSFRTAVRGDFSIGLGLLWVGACAFMAALAFTENVNFVTEELRKELVACVYSFSANFGICFVARNVARLNAFGFDDRKDQCNMGVLGLNVLTLMVVSHLFPKIDKDSVYAAWFIEMWSFGWFVLALTTNLALNAADEFRGGFMSKDALFGIISSSGVGLIYFALHSPYAKCFACALLFLGVSMHALGMGSRHHIMRWSTNAKQEGEEECVNHSKLD